MATTVLRSAAAVLGALAYVASATAPPSVHMLTGAPNAHAAAPEAIAPAKLGSRWIDAARHPVTASSQLTIVLDGTPDNGEDGQIAADAAATYTLTVDAAAASSTPLLLNELFTGQSAAPHRRKGAASVMTAATEPAALHDVVVELTEGQGLVLTVATDADALAVASPHAEVAGAHPPEALRLGSQPSAGLSARLARQVEAITAAEAPRLRNAAGQQVFDLTKPADAAFLRELAALKALEAVLADTEASALVRDDAQDLITIVLSSLAELRGAYGEDSEQYQTAWAQLNVAVPRATAAVLRAYENDATAAVVLVPGSRRASPPAAAAAKATPEQRARRAVKLPAQTRRGPHDEVPTRPCWESEAACAEAGCGGADSKGTCTQQHGCYVCKCDYSYAGDICQYYDISSIFWIMIFTVVFVLISVVITSSVTANIDPGTGTLLFKTAASGRPKSD